jgi:hypothetical protein
MEAEAISEADGIDGKGGRSRPLLRLEDVPEGTGKEPY